MLLDPEPILGPRSGRAWYKRRMTSALTEVCPGVHAWSRFEPSKGYDFNGHHLDLGDTRVLIDPVPFEEEVAQGIERLGRPALVIVTNKDHRRAAEAARQRWGARVLVHALDAPLLGLDADGTFADGELLAGALRVRHLPDQKSPGECALVWEARRLLILGDALIGEPAGRLRMLPEAKYADPAAARRSLVRSLDGLAVDGVLVGDGRSLPRDAAPVLRATLASLVE